MVKNYVIYSRCKTNLDNKKRKEKFDEFISKQFDKSKPQTSTQVRHTIPKAVQHEVWRIDEGRCMYCGSQKNLKFEHRIPISKGGSNTARNIQLLCEKCNKAKSNKI